MDVDEVDEVDEDDPKWTVDEKNCPSPNRGLEDYVPGRAVNGGMVIVGFPTANTCFCCYDFLWSSWVIYWYTYIYIHIYIYIYIYIWRCPKILVITLKSSKVRSCYNWYNRGFLGIPRVAVRLAGGLPCLPLTRQHLSELLGVEGIVFVKT